MKYTTKITKHVSVDENQVNEIMGYTIELYVYNELDMVFNVLELDIELITKLMEMDSLLRLGSITRLIEKISVLDKKQEEKGV